MSTSIVFGTLGILLNYSSDTVAQEVCGLHRIDTSEVVHYYKTEHFLCIRRRNITAEQTGLVNGRDKIIEANRRLAT